MLHDNGNHDELRKQKSGGVKLLEGDGAQPSGRRAFLQAMAAKGVLIPAAYVMWRTATETDMLVGEAHALVPAAAKSTGMRKTAVTGSARAGHVRIMRDFADPYLELVRLLQEASEIEHSLMLQYLYGAFSLKPMYRAIAGYGNPNANDLLGVAIQEMQHLAAVNRLLVALGAAPHLVREDFPYEPEIYPFEFHLEPLSVNSLAKYVYCEAPFDATDLRRAKTKADQAFHERLSTALGSKPRPNHIGSLYDSIIVALAEVRLASLSDLPDLEPWIEKLTEIKDEGERDHYAFFRQLFMGTDKGFNGHPDVWALKSDDPAYPALTLAANPTAYIGHPNQIQDPVALGVAWLGNLHYWTVLTLFDLGFRTGSSTYTDLAKQHMLGPVWTLARHLPKYGVGLPFDPLCSGYAPGVSRVATLRIIDRMLAEADGLTQKLSAHLPAEYPTGTARESMGIVKAEIKREIGRQA